MGGQFERYCFSCILRHDGVFRIVPLVVFLFAEVQLFEITASYEIDDIGRASLNIILTKQLSVLRKNNIPVFGSF